MRNEGRWLSLYEAEKVVRKHIRWLEKEGGLRAVNEKYEQQLDGPLRRWVKDTTSAQRYAFFRERGSRRPKVARQPLR